MSAIFIGLGLLFFALGGRDAKTDGWIDHGGDLGTRSGDATGAKQHALQARHVRAERPQLRGPGPQQRHGRRRLVSRERERDRKSTRLNSSHSQISYAVFCLKKKKSCISPT